MTILSNKISKDELKPGDHIYSWRQAYIYAHHGIYIGDDKVIHFTRGEGQEIGTGTVLDKIFSSSFPVKTDTPCPICGDQSNANGVVLSCLDCFLSGHELYLFQYSVNPVFFLAKARGGTCTTNNSDPLEDVIFRAHYLLKKGFGDYNIFKNNCEDFSIYCKTGCIVGGSGQAASFVAASSTLVSSLSSPLRFLTTSFPSLAVTTSFPGLAVVGAGMYCFCRLKSDMGMCRDVMKVPVERVVAQAILAQLQGSSKIANID